MTAPTSDRPTPRDDHAAAAPHVADDLDLAYRAAAALADGDRAPAPAVRANVLAAARAMALDAAARAPVTAPAVPGLATVTATDSTSPGDSRPAPQPIDLTLPGIGRALAANLSSWRVRAGAAACVALMAAAVAWRFDDRLLRPDEDTRVASVDLLPSRDPRLAHVAASPGVTLASPPVASEPQPDRVAMASAAAASSTDVARAMATPQVVAQADTDQPVTRSAPTPAGAASDGGRARDKVVVADAAPDEGPAPVTADAAPRSRATPRRVEAARAAAMSAPPVVVALAPPPPPVPAPPAFSAAPQAAPMAPAPQSLPSPAPEVQGDLKASASSTRHADAASDVATTDSRIAMAKSSVGSMASLGGSAESARAPLLQRAADRGDAALIARLLATGVAVDAVDADGRTALLHAVLSQHGAAVRALLAAGADPMYADASGLTPRAAAQRGADAGIAAMLAPR